jgi:cytochrome c oxidase subunit 3
MKTTLRSLAFADSLATAPGLRPVDGDEETGGTSPIPSNVLGVAIFIASEIMLFGGLLSAFMILRAENAQWPPIGQPRLPLLVTTLNSLVLFISGWTVIRAVSAAKNGERAALTKRLSLIHFGLTVSSSVYGGLFYTLVGVHAVHVIGAVVALGFVLRLARQGRYLPSDYSGVAACALYWCFVVLLWGVIYVTVYVS